MLVLYLIWCPINHLRCCDRKLGTLFWVVQPLLNIVHTQGVVTGTRVIDVFWFVVDVAVWAAFNTHLTSSQRVWIVEVKHITVWKQGKLKYAFWIKKIAKKKASTTNFKPSVFFLWILVSLFKLDWKSFLLLQMFPSES